MSLTFEEIKARYLKRQGPPPRIRTDAVEANADCGALIEMVEALQHLAHPHDKTRGICPLVLYFPTEEDRQDFAAIVREGFPDWKSVKLP